MRIPLLSLLLATATVIACPLTIAADVAPAPWPFSVPADSTMPTGPMGDAIRRGQQLAGQTQLQLKAYVGNGLTCSNCHLGDGKTQWASPWVGLWGVFPQYGVRGGQVEDLADRINDCFRRSMNGKPLPYDSEAMHALLAYIAWLSRGVPTGVEVVGRGFIPLDPPTSAQMDPVRGKALFAQKCSTCHGVDGQGVAGAGGSYAFPPLWGPRSFNTGAGMARVGIAAAFIQAKMPLGAGFTVSTQDAIDIAAYVTRQPRPVFANSRVDWPRGDRPADAR